LNLSSPTYVALADAIPCFSPGLGATGAPVMPASIHQLVLDRKSQSVIFKLPRAPCKCQETAVHSGQRADKEPGLQAQTNDSDKTKPYTQQPINKSEMYRND